MRDQRGFALLTTLWLVALMGVLAGALTVSARRESQLGANRTRLRRGEWAAEACLAIAEARYAADPTVRAIDTVQLGGGLWCAASLVDPASRINVNTASPSLLAAMLDSDSLAAAVLDWRDADSLPRPDGGAERPWYAEHQRDGPRNRSLETVAEMQAIRGFEKPSISQLEQHFTVLGDGRVNPNLLPAAWLAALPGFSAPVLQVLEQRRSTHRPIGSLEELVALTPAGPRREVSEAYRDLSQLLVFQPVWLEVSIEGGVADSRPVYRQRILAVPLAARLAVVGREPQ